MGSGGSIPPLGYAHNGQIHGSRTPEVRAKGNMNNYTVKDNAGQTWKRVSKSAARKAFDNGQAVHVCACNLMPFGYWQAGGTLRPGIEQHETKFNESEHWVDWFARQYSWHNCTGRETGLYASFYVQV